MDPAAGVILLQALRGADQAHLHQAIEVLEQAQKVPCKKAVLFPQFHWILVIHVAIIVEVLCRFFWGYYCLTSAIKWDTHIYIYNAIYIYLMPYIYIYINDIIDCNEGYIPVCWVITTVVPIANPNCTPKFGIKLSVNHWKSGFRSIYTCIYIYMFGMNPAHLLTILYGTSRWTDSIQNQCFLRGVYC